MSDMLTGALGELEAMTQDVVEKGRFDSKTTGAQWAAVSASHGARSASEDAWINGTKQEHEAAAIAHDTAAHKHSQVANHGDQQRFHEEKAADHRDAIKTGRMTHAARDAGPGGAAGSKTGGAQPVIKVGPRGGKIVGYSFGDLKRPIYEHDLHEGAAFRGEFEIRGTNNNTEIHRQHSMEQSRNAKDATAFTVAHGHPEAHAKAAKLHEAAANAHEVAEQHSMDPDNMHAVLAAGHRALAKEHEAKAGDGAMAVAHAHHDAAEAASKDAFDKNTPDAHAAAAKAHHTAANAYAHAEDDLGMPAGKNRSASAHRLAAEQHELYARDEGARDAQKKRNDEWEQEHGAGKHQAAPAKPEAKHDATPKPRDARLPAEGTEIKRQYKGKDVTVVERGGKFHLTHGGEDKGAFSSLSAAATHLAGHAQNGHLFFGTGKKAAEAEAKPAPAKASIDGQPKEYLSARETAASVSKAASHDGLTSAQRRFNRLADSVDRQTQKSFTWDATGLFAEAANARGVHAAFAIEKGLDGFFRIQASGTGLPGTFHEPHRTQDEAKAVVERYAADVLPLLGDKPR